MRRLGHVQREETMRIIMGVLMHLSAVIASHLGCFSLKAGKAIYVSLLMASLHGWASILETFGGQGSYGPASRGSIIY